MFKNIFKNNYVLIFAILLLFVTSLIAYVSYDKLTYKTMLENGIEVEARVIQNSMTSDVTMNNVEYYYVKFLYEDENGVVHNGKTSSKFTYSQALMLERHGNIRIKYNPETFASIEADYDFSQDKSAILFLILLVIFGIASVIAWIFAIKKIIQNFKSEKVIKYVNEYTATVISIACNLTVNNVQKYYVEYVWKNESNEQIRSKSPSIYNFATAREFKNMQTIKIKELNGVSSIVSEPNYEITNSVDILTNNTNGTNMFEPYFNENYHQNNTQPQVKTCPYCGGTIDSNENICQFCGSKLD